ncbi:alkaline phosphatase family protein [Candidatus Woesearchaeota archaeon]|nr:alkaline phosphatase family protein [Candidatus Woesearchaeota archaeon]
MKYPFPTPDYKGGSIVNLMSSIARGFGKRHRYAQLKALRAEEVRKSRNVVLIVIDGLGYEYLCAQGDSYLHRHLRSRMTSTFLSTTTCANTALLVGYPPQQHALTGWDINLKEAGAITSVLPFTPRYGGEPLTAAGFSMSDVMGAPSFYEGFGAECFVVFGKRIAGSEFTRHVTRHATIIPTVSVANAFAKITALIKEGSPRRRFVHAYFPGFDAAAHDEGVASAAARDVFLDLDRRVRKLARTIEGTDTKLVVVADHGMIDTTEEAELFVEDVPGLQACLTVPLAGEPRVRDCFVRPRKTEEFESIVRKRLAGQCWCYRGELLVNDHLYGLGKPNGKLLERVGDYVLVMKENYVLRDRLANDKERKASPVDKGVHGGVSDEELFVPLIIVDC